MDHSMEHPSEWRPIRALPAEVIERIAAGEIIERPAAALRELIENALDAGATSLRIELREGGLRLLRVADDGHGILPEELETACQPHTTSKIGTLGDLERITTLGFRGEALASIAAVADVELASAHDGAGLARALTLEAGQVAGQTYQPRERGTTVTVRDLFQRVPARRALLGGPRAETERCLRVARAYALAHPTHRWSVLSDGELALRTPGGSLASAVEALYGADAARALVPVGPVALAEGHMEGVIAGRALHFADRAGVTLLVNGRPVANRALLAAAEGGYRPLLRKGRHPLLVVRITVPPEQIDANTHPAKTVVLLRDEAAVASALRQAVHRALGAAPASLAALSPLDGHTSELRFLRPMPLHLTAPRRRRGLRLREGRGAYGGSAGMASLASAEDDIDADALDHGRLPALEPLAQFEATLILARSPAGHLFLVDQHRAHERVLYERLRQRGGSLAAALTRATMPPPTSGEMRMASSQLLLQPLVVELTPGQAAIFQSRLELLRSLGLDCQPFGGSVFLVRAVPQVAGAAQQADAFAEALVRDAADESESWLDTLCASLACRAAVRRGQTLSHAEQRALLADLASVEVPAACPHGSPLLLRYTRGALARAFEW